MQSTDEYFPNPYRVLFADDRIEEAKPYVEKLMENGIHVDQVPGVVPATEKLRETHYHAAIIDRKMPDANNVPSIDAGKQLLRHILEHHKDTSCVIFSDQEPALDDLKPLVVLGMYAYLEKTFTTVDELLGVVQEMFEKRKTPLRLLDSGKVVKADRMLFYGKQGTVIETVTANAETDVGIVEIENRQWFATLEDNESDTEKSPLVPGTSIVARAIYLGVIGVTVQR